MSQSDMEKPAESPESQTIEPESEVVAVSLSAEEILGNEAAAESESTDSAVSVADSQLLAVLEAIIYVTDEPLTLDQIAEAHAYMESNQQIGKVVVTVQ